MRRFISGALLILSLLCVGQRVAGQGIETFVKTANLLSERINAEDYAGVQSLFSPEMKAALPLNKSTTFFADLEQKFGKISKLDPPHVLPSAVIFTTHFERGILDLQLSLNQEGQIDGLYFKPHVSAKPVPEKNQTTLSLPFKQAWLVFWGGDTRQLNFHHDLPNQRYAFDLLGVGPDGQTHRRDGKINEDYYAFGRTVLAPADGLVTEVIEGVHDNVPGSMNPYSGVGNCVIIQHLDDEVSVLAHFKLGTIKVKSGDRVKRGQVLGLCGNSGNSSEPHIHFHLQHTAVLQDGVGIKCYFDQVKVRTSEHKLETRANYSPIKGDVIEP